MSSYTQVELIEKGPIFGQKMRMYTGMDAGADGMMVNGIEVCKMSWLTPLPADTGTFTVVLLMSVESSVTWCLLNTQNMLSNLEGLKKEEPMAPYKKNLNTCLKKNWGGYQ